MRKMQLKGRWVLVTGASAGLGVEIARDLASRHGANLLLVARRLERLDSLAAELASRHGVEARTLRADLSDLSDVDRVFHEGTEGTPIHAVVLNAGVTHFGPHDELPWERFETLLSTNVTSSVRLVSHFVPYLLAQGHAEREGGGIMLVTSMAGLVPVPYQTAYSASKAFLTAFGEGMHHELADKNVSLTTFAPGGIKTEMTETTGLDAAFGNSPQIMAADVCAKAAVDAMVARRYLAVPGLFNQLQLFLPRLSPRKLTTGVVANAYRRALRHRS